jgi:hypothetical protein
MGIAGALRRISIWTSAVLVAAGVTLFAADASTGNASAPMAPASVDPFEAKPPVLPESPRHEEQESEAKLPEVANEAGEALEVSGECEEGLAIAAKQGLTLPKGWAIHCVGPGLDWSGNSHWGVTCPYDSCPEGAGPYVSISNPTYYVIAHELCHANFGNDELMADSCAAKHGASLETSPYQ